MLDNLSDSQIQYLKRLMRRSGANDPGLVYPEQEAEQEDVRQLQAQMQESIGEILAGNDSAVQTLQVTLHRLVNAGALSVRKASDISIKYVGV